MAYLQGKINIQMTGYDDCRGELGGESIDTFHIIILGRVHWHRVFAAYSVSCQAVALDTAPSKQVFATYCPETEHQ
ncbi:hypothetical protein [Candidatus Spongiihabitans sp.]|uniref:hypothetical protein n=1 Tax=Candidatus Spongiihabitans sp. TaxID=3101308 RepID=UPI003C7D13D9